MSYEVNTKKSYDSPVEAISQTASQLLEMLGGKVSKANNPAKGQLEANFNKKIKNKALPNRCQLRVKIVPQSSNSCIVLAKVYPVDPMGNKLTFGVRSDASQVVSDTFFAELETKLGIIS